MALYHVLATLTLFAPKKGNSALTDQFSVEASYNKRGNVHKACVRRNIVAVERNKYLF